MRRVPGEERVHHTVAPRVREERLPEAEQAAGRDLVHAVDGPVVAVLHVLQDPAALADELHDGAEPVLGDLDLELLVRLLRFSVHDLADHLGLRHLELVPLAPHVLDEDREV